MTFIGNAEFLAIEEVCPLPVFSKTIGATVNIMVGRAIFRVDMGFYILSILRPLLKSLYRIHALLVNQ